MRGHAPAHGSLDHRRPRRRRRVALGRRPAHRPGRGRALHVRSQPRAADAHAEPGQPDRRRGWPARRRAVVAAGHPGHRQPALSLGLRSRPQRPAGRGQRRPHVPVARLRADDLRASGRRRRAAGRRLAHADPRTPVYDPLRVAQPATFPGDSSAITGFRNLAALALDDNMYLQTSDSTIGPAFLPTDPYGLDTEGLQRDPRDGSYWLSDEYRPSIVHLDRHGVMLQRIVPIGNGAPAAPTRPPRRPRCRTSTTAPRSPSCRSCCLASGRHAARIAASKASRCRPTAQSSTR